MDHDHFVSVLHVTCEDAKVSLRDLEGQLSGRLIDSDLGVLRDGNDPVLGA
jgi:hypothetical protein